MSNEANGGGMTRVEALEAVAEAAERVVRLGFVQSDGALAQSVAALRALDALPAAPEPARGEVVEVAVWEWPEDGDLRFARSGGAAGVDRHARGFDTKWRRLGTTRLPLVKGGGA